MKLIKVTFNLLDMRIYNYQYEGDIKRNDVVIVTIGNPPREKHAFVLDIKDEVPTDLPYAIKDVVRVCSPEEREEWLREQ